MEAKVYTVKFHFPYATVTLSKEPRWRVNNFQTYLRTKTHFEVTEGSYDYYINPELVTYMEVREYTPF